MKTWNFAYYFIFARIGGDTITAAPDYIRQIESHL